MAIIYRHLKPCGEVFYIGIGKTEKRAESKNNRNNHWTNIINKYGYEIQILKRDLSWEEACELEILLIAHYGRYDLGLGTLVNLTDGGEGIVGWIASDETRARMSESKKGKHPPNFGKKASDITRKRQSISATGRLKSEESKEKNRIASANVSEETKLKRHLKNKGKKRTKEQCNNISESKMGQITKLSIVLLHVDTGVYYVSVAEACRVFGYTRGELLGKLKSKTKNDTGLIRV